MRILGFGLAADGAAGLTAGLAAGCCATGLIPILGAALGAAAGAAAGLGAGAGLAGAFESRMEGFLTSGAGADAFGAVPPVFSLTRSGRINSRVSTGKMLG